MSSALGDKKGRVADSSDLTRLQRESAVLAAYTTYTGLSVNKKANLQLGNDRRFTLGRGGLTLKADATTGITRNPINGKVVVAPYTPPIYGSAFYAIPDFSTATVVSDGNPYIVSSDEKQYSVQASSVLVNNFGVYGGQNALIRSTIQASGWVSDFAYTAEGLPTSGIGESLTITAPRPFVLLAYSLGSGYGDINTPKSWILSGSTDGTTFKTIDTQTNQNLTDLTAITTYSLPNNTEPYAVYKLIVTDVPVGNNGLLAIRQFNLFAGVVVSE